MRHAGAERTGTRALSLWVSGGFGLGHWGTVGPASKRIERIPRNFLVRGGPTMPPCSCCVAALAALVALAASAAHDATADDDEDCVACGTLSHPFPWSLPHHR